MKRLIPLLLFGGFLLAQSTPDATQTFSFTGVKSGPSMSVFNGAPTGSANFRLTWLSTGFTGYTIALQGSQDGSTWANIDSSLIQQSTVNPTVWTSATKTNTIVGVVYLPYVRVNVSSVTGTGTITSYLVGYKGFARTSSGGSGGAVSITATGPIVITPSPTTGTGVISCPTCATGSAITALTGDGTATGPGSVPLTLATVNSGPGTCGDSTHVCQVTTNGKGLTTSQTAVGISGAGGGSQNIIGSANFTISGGAITGLTKTGVVSAANYVTAGEYSLTLSGVSTANYNTLIQFGNPGGPAAVPAITSPTPTTTLVTFGACQPSTNCGSFVEQSIVNVIITQ